MTSMYTQDNQTPIPISQSWQFRFTDKYPTAPARLLWLLVRVSVIFRKCLSKFFRQSCFPHHFIFVAGNPVDMTGISFHVNSSPMTMIQYFYAPNAQYYTSQSSSLQYKTWHYVGAVYDYSQGYYFL